MKRLHRRAFLATSGAAATATVALATSTVQAALPAPAVLLGTKDLTLAMAWPNTVSGFGASAARLARRIEIASEKRLRIVLQPVEEGKAAAPGLRAADLTHAFADDPAWAHPGLAYVAGLPGFVGLSALDLAAWVSVGGGQDLWDDLGARFGVKPLLAGHTGRGPGLWSVAPLEEIPGLGGQKVLTRGLARALVHGLGGEAVDIPLQTAAGAFAVGDLTAAEGHGFEMDMTLGLPRAARHFTAGGLSPSGSALAFTVKTSVWDRWSAADRRLVTACATEEFHLTLAETRAHAGLQRQALLRAGVTLGNLPEQLREASSRIAEAVVAHTAATDADTQRIDASYMAFRKALSGEGGPFAGA